MTKKIIPFIIACSILSAGLLYMGFLILSQYTPAFASSQKPLVAEGISQDSAALVNSENSLSSGEESTSGNDTLVSSPEQSAAPASPQVSNQVQTLLISTSSGETPVTSITIAELLNNPELYEDAVVSITGIATTLNHEKFLLNDGTGQILVEVEEEFIDLSVINGLSVTVVGKLDDSSSSSGLEVEAFSITYQGKTIIVHDDLDDSDDMDDGDDDMDDDLDDHGDDDDDDHGDDDHDDDDSDGGSSDDSGSDSSDD